MGHLERHARQGAMIRKTNRRGALFAIGAAGAAAIAGNGTSFAINLTEQDQPASSLSLAGNPAEFQITRISTNTVRVSFLPLNAQGIAQKIEDNLILVPKAWPEPCAKVRQTEPKQELHCGNVIAGLTGKSLSLAIRNEQGTGIQRLTVDTRTAEVTFLLGDEPIYGLGEGGPQFDRRGEIYPMKHGERVPGLAVTGARLSIPWLLGTDGWALLFHQPFGSFDLTGPKGRFKPWPDSPVLPLDFFIVTGKPGQILSEYARLTGYPHMPPVWALGYQQSHRTLASREEVMEEARTFREKQLPCDVLIYLGTGFCPSGWNLGHGSYVFNPKAFPDPKKMISEMHAEHFHIMLHEDKPPRHLHGRATDTGRAAKVPEDAADYWRQHLEVFDLGVDGWWADEGDWLDNRSCLVRNRMYWEGGRMSRPNIRPYTLNRNGYAGLQRYGWLWSGDIDSTWEALRAQVAVGLNTGLSGIPYWGTDTGGFFATKELTGELYVRWFQFSAFCPLFRSHGRTWKLRLPWGWNTGSYGPIEGPVSKLPPREELHNPEVEPICRKYLELRYRLKPYLYSLVRQAHDTGLPLMRPLWLDDPHDPKARRCHDEYLFGPSFLVAPILEKGATGRMLYLPRGGWYDFWTEDKISGGKEIRKVVDLGTLPLYIRAGSILPLGPVKQYMTEPGKDTLQLIIYPGRDGEFSLYEDDGVSFNYEEGQYARIESRWDDHERRLSISLTKGAASYEFHEREFEIRLAGENTLRKIRFTGSPAIVQL